MYNDSHEALATIFKEDSEVPSQVTFCQLLSAHRLQSRVPLSQACK